MGSGWIEEEHVAYERPLHETRSRLNALLVRASAMRSPASEGEPGRAVKYPSASEAALCCDGERNIPSIGVATTNSASVRDDVEASVARRLVLAEAAAWEVGAGVVMAVGLGEGSGLVADRGVMEPLVPDRNRFLRPPRCSSVSSAGELSGEVAVTLRSESAGLSDARR